MGLLYKTYNHLCMESMQWGVDKGKKVLAKQEKENHQQKIDFHDGYSKWDNILKRTMDENENQVVDGYDIYDF